MARKKPIQKDGTSQHWKKLIMLKKCSFCSTNSSPVQAMFYEKFKYYCKQCYEKTFGVTK